MSLASFDLTVRGLTREVATSEDAALATAVIALDHLLSHATAALYGHIVEPQVDVRRGARLGAYEFDLGFRGNFGMARRAALSGLPRWSDPRPEAVLRALGWWSPDLAEPRAEEISPRLVPGLVPLLIALGGREADWSRPGEDLAEVMADGQRWLLSHDCYALWRDRASRQDLADLSACLSLSGVESLEISARGDNSRLCLLTPAEASCLALPPSRDGTRLSDERRVEILQLASPVFRDERSWLFSDGLNTLRLTMADRAFLSAADAGVVELSPGELLVCRVHLTACYGPSGLRSSQVIERVLERRVPGAHLDLPMVG